MDGSVAARPHARDADGNAVMSLDELKENMFQSIRDNGTVELIRAQLRRQFIEKLQHQCRPNDEPVVDNNNSSRVKRTGTGMTSTPDEKLVQGLIAEYLATMQLDNTLAVFVPEIGGPRNHLDSATIVKMLHVSTSVQQQLDVERGTSTHSLLLVLVRELVRRYQLVTMTSETQTVLDCVDHRISLETQLRSVETRYFADSAAHELEPQHTLEEQMFQYQRDYDVLCEHRFQEQLERYKSTELALVRVQERQRFDQQVEALRASLEQEAQTATRRLQEHERDVEQSFFARKTALETSLFETRQTLVNKMEELRGKEAAWHVKSEREARELARETQRLQLWEERVQSQEALIETRVAQRMHEKEKAWQDERQEAEQELERKQMDVKKRQETLETTTETIETLRTQVVDLKHDLARLEAAFSKARDELKVAECLALDEEKARRRREEDVATVERTLEEHQKLLVETQARVKQVESDKRWMSTELLRYKEKHLMKKEQVQGLVVANRQLQEQLLSMQQDEAKAMGVERKKGLQVLEEEREQWRWKENEALTTIRELERRVATAETLADKVQSQYEDEKVHVEALRHEVASLNALWMQAQATINTKHRDGMSFRRRPRGMDEREALESMGRRTKRRDGRASLYLEKGEKEGRRVEEDDAGKGFGEEQVRRVEAWEEEEEKEKMRRRMRMMERQELEMEEEEERERLEEEEERTRWRQERREEEQKRREEAQRRQVVEREARLQEERRAKEAVEMQRKVSQEREIVEEIKRREEHEEEVEEMKRRREEEEEEEEEEECGKEEELKGCQEQETVQEETRVDLETREEEEEKEEEKEEKEKEEKETVDEQERLIHEAKDELSVESIENASFVELVGENGGQGIEESTEDVAALRPEDTNDDSLVLVEREEGTLLVQSVQEEEKENDVTTADETKTTKKEEEEENDDNNVMNLYRQRVLARKAAEKEQEKKKETQLNQERERVVEGLSDASDSDDLSGGSFAESSVASTSDSF